MAFGALPARPVAASVPKLWPGCTVVCIGTGPSLTTEDVAFVQGKARVIAVNDAYKLAPWADVLYAADAKWWGWHKGAPTFKGSLKFALQPGALRWPGVQMLRRGSLDGLDLDPRVVRTGFNSGYQAINVAVHLGAAKIVLLGYDMRGQHYFGKHPDRTVPPFPLCLAKFATLVAPLAALHIAIVNATRDTALTCFPRVSLEDALQAVAA